MPSRTSLVRHYTIPTCTALKHFYCIKCEPPKLYHQRASLHDHVMNFHGVSGLSAIKDCCEDTLACWRCLAHMPLADLQQHLKEHEEKDSDLESIGPDITPPASCKKQRRKPAKSTQSSQQVASDSDSEDTIIPPEKSPSPPPKKRRKRTRAVSPPPSTEEDSQPAQPKRFSTKNPGKKDQRKQLPHWSTTPSPASSPTLPSMEEQDTEEHRQQVEMAKRALFLHETTEESSVSTRSTRASTRAAAAAKRKGKGTGKKTKK